MTDGQQRYQALMEERRHNLEVERYNSEQNRLRGEENALKARSVSVDEAWLPYRVAESQAKIVNLGYQNADIVNGMTKGWIDSIFGGAKDRLEKGVGSITRFLFS